MPSEICGLTVKDSFYGSVESSDASRNPLLRKAQYNKKGVSPSGKAQHFDCCMRWFESNYPCSYERESCETADNIVSIAILSNRVMSNTISRIL